MDLSELAATAAEHPGGALVALALAWLAYYAAVCVWWPYTSHGRCSGTGKLRSPSGRSWRRCPGCKGKGSRIRIGRQMWGQLDKLRD